MADIIKIEVKEVIREIRNAPGSVGLWGELGGNLQDQEDLHQKFTELEQSIEGKQPTGDYATNAALTSALADLQAAGDYATSSALATGLAGKADLVAGKVPASQLPAYVDDVVEYANLAAFPATGAEGIIYVALDTDLTYRWSGTQYIAIASGAVTAVNNKTGNITLTKADIGLDKVVNMTEAERNADAATLTNKTISGATNTFSNIPQSAVTGLTTALEGKQPTGDYATNTALATGLASKQPTGDYATVSALNAGLSAKQPVGDYATSEDVTNGLAAKQNTLVSGTNIKTINGISLLGAGDIPISGGGGSSDFVNTTITGLRAITAPSIMLTYFVTDSGKQGPFYHDSTDTTSPDDGALCLVSSNGNRFKRFIENNTVYLKWFAGVSDYTPVIKALVDKGYKIVGEPGATYILNSTASFDKLQLDGNDCVFQVNYTGSSDFLWDIKTTAGTNYTPTAISDWNRSATVSTNTMFTNIGLGGNHGSSYLTFAGNLTAAFPIGTVAKLWSVDEYVPGFGAIQKGDWLVVEAVAYDSTSNTTRIAVQGSFSYKYNTVASLRLCAVSRNKVSLKNFRLVQNVTNLNILTHIRLQGVVHAEMHNVTIENTYRAAVQVMGAYGFRATGCTFLNSQNQPPEGFGPSGAASGYGLDLMHDFGSRVEGCHFYNIRHGVTTDAYTNNATGSTTTPFYTGETSGLVVANCTAKGCAHAYDTHPWGFNITFVNCTAEGCGTAFQIRSRETRVIGGSAHRCWQPIFCVINAAQSGIYDSPIVFDGVSIDDLHPDSSTVMKISNGINSPYIIRNCNFRGGMIESTKGDMTITGCTFNMTRTGDGGTEVGRWLQLTSCKVRVMGTHVKTTASSVQGIMFQGTDTTVTVESLIFESLTATNPSIATGANGSTLATTAKLVVKDMLFLVNGPSHTTSAFPVLSTSAFDTIRIKWRSDTETATTSNENSCYFNLTGSGALNIDTVCKYLTDENIFVKANISAAASIASFPAGQFAGQRITIQNIAAFALTLPTLSSGARSLTQWQSATIVWTSTEWIYV